MCACASRLPWKCPGLTEVLQQSCKSVSAKKCHWACIAKVWFYTGFSCIHDEYKSSHCCCGSCFCTAFLLNTVRTGCVCLNCFSSIISCLEFILSLQDLDFFYCIELWNNADLQWYVSTTCRHLFGKAACRVSCTQFSEKIKNWSSSRCCVKRTYMLAMVEASNPPTSALQTI